MDSFEDHLAYLAQFYHFDTTALPQPDEILAGVTERWDQHHGRARPDNPHLPITIVLECMKLLDAEYRSYLRTGTPGERQFLSYRVNRFLAWVLDQNDDEMVGVVTTYRHNLISRILKVIDTERVPLLLRWRSTLESCQDDAISTTVQKR